MPISPLSKAPVCAFLSTCPTGMPAWGVTHDDELLWDVVAFVRKLPELTPEQYESLVKNAPKHEQLMDDMEMEAP